MRGCVSSSRSALSPFSSFTLRESSISSGKVSKSVIHIDELFSQTLMLISFLFLCLRNRFITGLSQSGDFSRPVVEVFRVKY